MLTALQSSIDTSRLAWAGNKIWFEMTADTAWADSRYYVLCKLYMGADVAPAFTMPTTPAPNGKIFVELQGAVSAIMRQDIFSKDNQLPTFGQIAPRKTDQPYSFRVDFEEYTDGVLTHTISRNFRAIDAGLDYDDFSYQKQRDWLYVNRKFFTSTADDKPTVPGLPEYIYFFCSYISVAQVDVVVRLYLTDDSEYDYIAFSGFSHDGKTIVIPTGTDALGIEANTPTGKTVYKYRVWLTKAGDDTYRVSEPFSYTLAAQGYLEKRVFLFKNSLGGYETFYADMAISEQIVSKKLIAERVYGKDYRVRDGQYFTAAREGTRSLSAATSWLPKDFADTLQDAAISPEMWEIIGGQYVPFIVESLTAFYYEKNNELRGYVFSGRYAYEVDLYTKDIARPADGLPVPPAEPTYIERLLMHARGNDSFPVIELNIKLDDFDIVDVLGACNTVYFRYSEATTPDWDSLTKLSKSEALGLILAGGGVYKLQVVPEYANMNNEATFIFIYEELGEAPVTQSINYNYGTISIDTVLGFDRKINELTFTPTPSVPNYIKFKVRTSAATSWSTVSALDLDVALDTLDAQPVDTPFELMVILYHGTGSRSFNFTYQYQ